VVQVAQISVWLVVLVAAQQGIAIRGLEALEHLVKEMQAALL